MGTTESTEQTMKTTTATIQSQPQQQPTNTIMNFFYGQTQQQQQQPRKTTSTRLQGAQTKEPGADEKQRASTNITKIEQQITAQEKEIAILKECIRRQGRNNSILGKIQVLEIDVQRKRQIVDNLQRNSMKMDNSVMLGQTTRLINDMSLVVDQELSTVSPLQLEKMTKNSEKQDSRLDDLFEHLGGQYSTDIELAVEQNDDLYSKIMAESQPVPVVTTTVPQQNVQLQQRQTTSNSNNTRVNQILRY
jgi:hypothetical protein